MNSLKLSFLVLVIAVGMFITPGKTEAAVFKCVDASGSTTYSQVPCPTADETETVMSTNTSAKENLDCRIANNFARDTAGLMRRGVTSGELFSQYGGIDAMPRTSIGVVNYVYTHKNNPDISEQRIAALSAARCEGNAYGPVDCDDFPYSFVADRGGCEAAAKSLLGPAALMAKDKAATTDTNNTNVETNHALGAKTLNDGLGSSEDCKKGVQAQLDALFAKMRSGQSAQGMDELKSERGALQAKKSGC